MTLAVETNMTATITIPQAKRHSRVLEIDAEDPSSAVQHFRTKLAFETDPLDVYTDLQNGETNFIVIDTRTPDAYARGHVPGSINLWHRKISAETTSSLPKDKLLVTYCAGVYCNASTKAAAKLAALGFRVKEMLDGIEGWKREGYPLENANGPLTAKNPVNP